MNDVKNKIRGYNKREPIRDKKFAFSNDLISRAVYSGNNGRPDKRFDLKTEGLSLWIRANGIKTFYAFKKREMFNKNKLKIEKNNVYKKIFRYEETVHRNLAAAKDALPSILKELSAPKLESKQDHSFGSMAKDFLKNGLNNYRLADRGEKFEYKEATKRKYRKLINSYILLKGHKDIVERLSSPLVFKEKFYTKPFKDLQMKDISVREIEVLQHRLSSTKTLSNDVLRIVSVIYSWANANDKYKGSNPVRSVVKFASNKIRVKLSDYEVKQLIDHCSSKAFDFDPRFLSLVHLDLLNGKRGSELFGIRWNAPTNDKEFVNKIIEFDNRRYGFFKTIKNSIIFKNKLNSYNFDRVILTSNARRLILPVILCNALKKDIMGNGKFIFNKDRSLDHLTISERLLKYTKDLKLPVNIQNFFLKNYKSNSSNKNIFISIDSHHNQNNWPLQNYIKLIKKINKKKIYLNFSPNHKYFLNFFKKENIKHKKIIFTYNKPIKEIIKIIKKCGIIIGNESGPVCLGASYKKKVHAIYLPIHTKPESKIIYKNSVYYNASKISDSKIINRILTNILSS